MPATQATAPSIRVKVQRDNIDKAMRNSSSHCMIAEAIKETYPRLTRVSVDVQSIRATNPKKGERYVWMTPRAVQSKVIAFDAGKKVESFEFETKVGTSRPMIQYSEEQKEKMRKNWRKKYAPKVQSGVRAKAKKRNAKASTASSHREFGLRALSV